VEKRRPSGEVKTAVAEKMMDTSNKIELTEADIIVPAAAAPAANSSRSKNWPPRWEAPWSLALGGG